MHAVAIEPFLSIILFAHPFFTLFNNRLTLCFFAISLLARFYHLSTHSPDTRLFCFQSLEVIVTVFPLSWLRHSFKKPTLYQIDGQWYWYWTMARVAIEILVLKAHPPLPYRPSLSLTLIRLLPSLFSFPVTSLFLEIKILYTKSTPPAFSLTLTRLCLSWRQRGWSQILLYSIPNISTIPSRDVHPHLLSNPCSFPPLYFSIFELAVVNNDGFLLFLRK